MALLIYRSRLRPMAICTIVISSIFTLAFIFSKNYLFQSKINIEFTQYGQQYKNAVIFIKPEERVAFLKEKSETTTVICDPKLQTSETPSVSEAKASSITPSPPTSTTLPANNNIESQDVLQSINVLPFRKARLDRHGIVKIYDWIWTAEHLNEFNDNDFQVCLSTQGSMDRIHWILEVVDNWEGPVSLAVFIVSPEEWIGLNILVQYYKKCSPIFKKFVSIHVAMPAHIKEWNMNWLDLELEEQETNAFYKTLQNQNCSASDSVNFARQVEKRFKPNIFSKDLMNEYPQNHMRNIAKRACATNWILASDIDIIPKPGSAPDLQRFLWTLEAQNCDKCAFVIPTFELDKKKAYPRTKSEIVKYWRKNHVARPFHMGVYPPAHNATDYNKWRSTNLKEEAIKISHDADKKFRAYYEPFYISPSTIPDFQERFIGYGWTRNSQVQEALVEGWSFKVLTPIFGIHWGLQNPQNLLNPGNEKATRRKQTYFNKRIYRRFMRELDLRKRFIKEEEKEKKEKLPDFTKY